MTKDTARVVLTADGSVSLWFEDAHLEVYDTDGVLLVIGDDDYREFDTLREALEHLTTFRHALASPKEHE